MVTQSITRIDPVQYGKVLAILLAIIYGIAGIVMTIFVGIVGAALSSFPGADATAFAGLGIVGGLILTVTMVVFGLIGGFVMGAICALIYNFVAGIVGGIKIDLE